MPTALNLSQFQSKINSIFPNEPITILDYAKATAPCHYKCNKCNTISYIYKGTALYKKQHLCNNCYIQPGTGAATIDKKQSILQWFQNQSTLQFLNWGYNHKLYKTTVKFKCLKCNGSFELQITQFLKRPQCCSCSYNAKHITTTAAQLRIPQEYTLLEPYENSDKKILVRHEICGFIWKAPVHGLLSDYRCPKCSKRHSKGEQNIIAWLNNHHIDFEIEKVFTWNPTRRYDFYIPSYNLIIEYMGIQHYQFVPHFKISLEEQQQIDKSKQDLALQHTYQYLVIPYTEYPNIDTILAQRLSHNESRENPETESILRDEDIV